MKRTIGFLAGSLLLWMGVVADAQLTIAIAAVVQMDGIILTPSSAPGSPVDGQCWTTSAGMFCRIAGSTVGPFGVAGGTVTNVPNPTVFGITCSVATATTTPAITCTGPVGVPGGGTGAATLTGILLGNGTSPVTAGNLSGDCTTSGLVITCTKINGDSNIAFLDVAQSFTKPQRTNTISPTISTATFTPVFSTSQNYRIVLSSACPCTLANPAAIVAGQAGMFEIVQDGTGSRAIGTYGSEYEYAGGTSTITLSTAASAVDYIPYYVDSTGSFIVLGGIIKGPTH